MTFRNRLATGTIILLAAAFLRLWMYDDVPPGLQHDEVFNAEAAVHLIDDGYLRLYYPSNQGREGAFVWLLGLPYLFFGINSLMIKFPAFVCGLLTVGLTYRFGFQNYSSRAGVVAGGLTAVSFWAVFTSRVGLRAVMLPVIVLLVLIGLSRLLNTHQTGKRRRIAILTGLALGFAIYTYTSSLAMYLSYGLFVVILAIFHPTLFRRIWIEIFLVGIIAALITLPMAHHYITDPQGAARAKNIAKPLRNAIRGDPQWMFDNATRLIGMPAFVGDPTWRYNVSGRPLFPLPIGLLVYFGLAIALARARLAPVNIYLVALTLFGLIPSLLTILAPSYLRSIAIMPSVMLFVGISVSKLSEMFSKRPALGWSLAIVVVAATGIADYRAYFVDWEASKNTGLDFHHAKEQGDKVHEIYRDDLQQLAHNLQDRNEETVFVSVPDTALDPLVYKFSDAPSQSDLQVVFFNASNSMILSQQPGRLFLSPFSPISEKFAQWLKEESGTRHADPIFRQDGKLAFQVYELTSEPELLAATLAAASARKVFIESEAIGRVELKFPILFGDRIPELGLLGIDIPRETIFGESDSIDIQLYFRPLVKSSGATVIAFVHLVSQNGEIVGQRDFLGISPSFWNPDFYFVQDSSILLQQRIEAGVYGLQMGIYDWRTGFRSPIRDADNQPIADRLFIGEIQVRDRPPQ